ncbi:MAG: hypothetical protein Q9220_000166 [cf. Caloplaca sp. 1 TL-2023]
MSFPPPHPAAAQNSLVSGSTKSSGVRQLKSQQSAWGLPPPGTSARRGLAPLSTDLGSSALESSNRPPTNTASPSPFASTFSAVLGSTSRNNSSRVIYSASPSSSYPPLQSGSQAAQATPSLLSPRSRAITPSSSIQLPSSAAASSTASQGGGGSSGGGGGSRSQTFSPSLPQQTLASPLSTTFDRSAVQGTPSSTLGLTGSSSVSKIVVTQVFILLGSITEKEGRAKWEAQAEAIRKLVESNGMDVFAKYFRRLLLGNSPQIFSGINRTVENPGNYQLLVQEMEKIVHDPAQATKIAEIIDTSEGDIYRDFDLATFIDHFKLDPLAKTLLASAFLHVSKADLNTKAGTILSQNFTSLLQILAGGQNDELDDDIPVSLLATCAFKYLTDLPQRFRSAADKAKITEAFHTRYANRNLVIQPLVVRSTMALADAMETGFDLVKEIHSVGPRATASIEATKELLSRLPDEVLTERQIAEALLYLVLTPECQQYSTSIFLSAIQEHLPRSLNWSSVVREFDRNGLVIGSAQFLSLYNALLSTTHQDRNFDIQLLWTGRWQHPTTQLYFVLAFTSLPPSDLDATTIPDLQLAYDPQECTDGPEDVTQYIDEAQRDTSISLEAVTAIVDLAFSREFELSREDVTAVSDLLQGPKMGYLLCSLLGIPQPQREIIESTMERFLSLTLNRGHANYSFTLHSLWKQDRSWLATKLSMFVIQNPLQLPIVLDHAQEHEWLDDLLTLTTGFGMDLAALAHRKNLIDLDQWAQDKLSNRTNDLTRTLSKYLQIKVDDEQRVARGEQNTSLMVPLAIKTVVAMLNILDENTVVRPDDLVVLERTCLSTYPRIIIYEEGSDEGDDIFEINRLSESADAEMQEFYKRMYSGELNFTDIIHHMQGFRESEDPEKRDLFACMIHGLFDEYSCFGDYPAEPLATTAVLFGGIISFHLISGVALRVGLGMIFEAVRDHNPSDSMYKFGLQALMNMQQVLDEWPGYCADLANIPGLHGTELHARLMEILSRHGLQDRLSPDQNGLNGLPDGLGLSNGEIEEYLTPNIQFRSVHAEPLAPGLLEEPDQGVQEKVVFFFNNVAPQNLASKVQELQQALPEQHRQWFAFVLVEQRAKLEPNQQELYLDLLKMLGDQLLWAEVLRETYVSVQRMLNSESTMQSLNERKNLKNLAAWLGSLTVARDKPIKHKYISFKDLLIEGHETERLLIVIPFVCNVLAQAKHSMVFKPPNPWTVDIVQVLLELYRYVELKLNQKFEIEVLCKELDVNRNTMEASTEIRSRPLQEEELSGAIMSEALDGFDDLTLNGINRGSRNARFSPSTIASTLPDFSRDLRFPPSSGSPATQARLREIVQGAVQRAIIEIIAPVVERSVTIATIATTNLIHKDFAREENEERIRKAAQQMVRQLSGSLALVTCKEPLRMSMNNYIRVEQAELPENPIPEGAVLMCVNDNLDIACEIVQKQAEERSMPEIEGHIEREIEIRRQHRADHPNEQYIGPAYNGWSGIIPDPYRIAAGGLNQEQMAIYLDFARQSRGPTSHGQTPSADSGRQLPDILQEAFTMPNLPTPAEPPALPLHLPPQHQTGRMLPPPVPHPGSQPQTNGYYEPRALPDRIQDLLEHVIHLARERPEKALRDLNQKGPLINAINQMWDLIVSNPLQVESIAWATANMAWTGLYRNTNNQLEVDVLVQLLDKLCQLSANINKEVVVGFANQEDERALYSAVTIALLEIGLLEVRHVDAAIARLLADRREEAVQTLSDIMDSLLLSDNPVILRSDFASSLSETGQWLSAVPDLKVAADLVRRLQEWGAPEITPSEPNERSHIKQFQLQYTFNEWLSLCNHPTSTDKILGAFISQLHRKQILNSQEDVMLFFRICIDCAVDAYEQDEGIAANEGYFAVDGLAKLIVLLVKHQGEADGAVKGSKTDYMHSLISLVILILNNHHVMRGEHFNQRVFFRLFSSILCDWNDLTPSNPQHDRDMVLVFAESFLMLQPRYLPAFTYSWLMLVSHRMFMPALLKLPDDEGWEAYANIVDALFSYINDMLRPPIAVSSAKDLYRGALRILLILHHDFPEFLAENHYRLCNSVPPHCTQLRNLILSAFPSSFAEVPDPFTAGLKVDRLEEIRRAPRIGGDILAPLLRTQLKKVLDGAISSGNVTDDTVQIISLTCGSSHTGIDTQLLHSIVLYLGQSAIEVASQKGGPNFDSTSPQARLMTKLAREVQPQVRYHLLSAITNQLRYPNSHTHYFSYALLHIFGNNLADQQESDVRQQITRVLLERLIVHRPHPWGLIITLLELLKNPAYMFWELPFIKAAPEIERLFAALFDTIHSNPRHLMEALEWLRGLIKTSWETALLPFHAVVSKPAQRAYLGTALVAATSLLLLGVSSVAYILFYWGFVPDVSVERDVGLQFGESHHPYGLATLGSSLTSLQPYDVTVFLHLPRTPNNIAAGNFMLDLELLAPLPPSSKGTKVEVGQQQRLAHARRAAILTYASPVVDTASTVVGLPWYILGWKTESERLEVKMFEGVEFPRGWTNVPQSLKLVVEADGGEKMQFYEVGVRIAARFGGLRWIMYHHRILSYIIFTSLFWSSSMISALVAWLVLSSYLSTHHTTAKKEEPDNFPKIKTEPSESEKYDQSLTEGLSDTSRTFPTLGRQMPLHFSGGRADDAGRGKERAMKQEEVVQSAKIQPLIAEADDEDEDEDFETAGFKDSGIGTSLDESQRARLYRRRRSSGK